MPEELTKGAVKPNAQASPGPIGNTQGIIVPKTATHPAGDSAPKPQPQPKEEGWWKRWGSDWTHGLLDGVGLIPVAGEAANAIGALVYLAEGDKISAAMDFAAMWPAGGQAATAAKYGRKAVGVAVEQAEKAAAKETAEAATKRLAKEAEEAAAKKAAREAEEKATKGGMLKGRRSQSERRKALLRDAKDPNSGLSNRSRKQIIDSKGKLVSRNLSMEMFQAKYHLFRPYGSDNRMPETVAVRPYSGLPLLEFGNELMMGMNEWRTTGKS